MQKTPKEYIIFPLDFPGMEVARSHIRQLDGWVGMFKIGLELFIRQGPAVVEEVRKMSSAGIFLDLKLHDISTTVGRAMARVADLGVDLVTVHGACSPKMLGAAVENAGKTKVLAVTLLTDNDADMVRAQGFKDEYATAPEKLVLLRARMALDAGCAGVVCSGQEAAMLKALLDKGCLTVTPGIRPQWSITPGDDQKRVVTPAKAVQAGSDYIVIGRPIRDAKDPARAAEKVALEIEAGLSGTAT
ncbi:MAG: orotidine-5'-phosphate decarboxylase [Desulfobacter postgatei]|uniref:Orotidine 5'-phosphate decarboxylase n=1 Tax=Desulfobacter postgatei TaxID=2293 RepID=A0A2G6MQ26_9BACT|nr:MAG: orotidine-5'-phosphate decarboxylase [Desulfobacter postgatei]